MSSARALLIVTLVVLRSTSALPSRTRRRVGSSRPAALPSSADPVPCCPPWGPTAPPPFAGAYDTRWFTQPRDHFNYFAPLDSPNATFQQVRLLLWRGGGGVCR